MSRVEKLCAACELFSLALKEIPGKASETLGQSCAGVRSFVATAREGTPKPTPSQLAAGLEQGWREVLDSLSGFPKEWRPAVAKAWFSATERAYPEFMANEERRLAKVLQRGRIRTEAEFYRVRHEIDVLEGQPDRQAELQRLYSIIGDFESRL
ncbi:hypothetical protein [Variovorax sp. 38R]|uniref:hypothetical protein n=1 Tax=Variovorax sp. 38R TaxID=2774875 RepID=UPI00177CDA5E|nr:hypothetical protein [Variovorax sp. 38R]QOF75930.1 hypothetical protein IG196_16020 [Variovorax sp. 38R]